MKELFNDIKAKQLSYLIERDKVNDNKQNNDKERRQKADPPRHGCGRLIFNNYTVRQKRILKILIEHIDVRKLIALLRIVKEC